MSDQACLIICEVKHNFDFAKLCGKIDFLPTKIKYLEFIDNKPVTGIPFLDAKIDDSYKVGDPVIFQHNGNRFIITLDTDSMTISTFNLFKTRCDYRDSEMFFNIINYIHDLSFIIGEDSVILEIFYNRVVLVINGLCIFSTDLIKNLPFGEFLEITRSILESLIGENEYNYKDLKHRAQLANDYDAAMTTFLNGKITKRAI